MKSIVFLLVLGLMAIGASAGAQASTTPTQTVSSIGLTGHSMPEVKPLAVQEEEARAILRRYVDCLIQRYPRVVSSAIVLRQGRDVAILRKINSEYCAVYAVQVGGTLRASDSIMLGMLFGELYRQHQASQMRSEWPFPFTALDLSAPPVTERGSETLAHFYMLVVSDCVFKRRPEIVRTIVTSPPGSAEQNQAFALVPPELGSCVTQGQTLKFSRAVIEASFGEYLYKLLALVPVANSEVSH